MYLAVITRTMADACNERFVLRQSFDTQHEARRAIEREFRFYRRPFSSLLGSVEINWHSPDAIKAIEARFS